MTEPKRVSIWALLAIATMFVVFVFDIAYGDIRSNSGTNIDQDVKTIVDAGSTTKSYGLSQSLGDVDINDCLASTQWGIIVFQKQKLVENPWCQSQYLDAIGAHEAAAKVRCTTDTLKAAYPVESECIRAVTAREREIIVPESSRDSEDDEDYHELEDVYARISAIEAQRQSDAENARKAAIRANRAAREAEQAEVQRKERAQQAYVDYQEQFIEQD